MHKLLVILLTSLTIMRAGASEPETAVIQPEVAVAQSSYADVLVTIAPVPMQGRIIELESYAPKSRSIKQTKRLTATTVARAKSMLSRSTREQIALANTSAKPDDRARLTVSDDEDDDSGIDDLDLHRSFSQPKVAKTSDQIDDDERSGIDLPDHIKLRLLMARTKAVEAHILIQSGKASGSADEELSDTAKLRLYIARVRAIKVHSEKYGIA